MSEISPKYFCFADANGNPVKVPLDEKPEPLSEKEKKEFSDAVHKALKQWKYSCRNPHRYTKEELEEFVRFVLDPPEFKPEKGEITDEN